MTLRLAPALDFSPPELISLLNAGFKGYMVDIKFTPALLNYVLRQDHVDLNASQIILDGDQKVGVALVARRGWTSRIAAMGIVSERRGQGAGEWLMRQIITQAGERRDRWVVLEVIEQNWPAVHLYQKL